MLNYRCIPLLLLIGIFGLAEAADDETEPLLALMTDSVVVEINQPPEKVWAHVKRLYRDGDRYRQMGLIVTPITDDPSAYLGGYHGAPKDETDSEAPNLAVYLSAVDEDNMFLAMFMDGVSPKGLYMTLDVSPSNTGTRQLMVPTKPLPKNGLRCTGQSD